jgi:hypothetical protein
MNKLPFFPQMVTQDLQAQLACLLLQAAQELPI